MLTGDVERTADRRAEVVDDAACRSDVDVDENRGVMETHLYRDKPMGVHGLHNWWYRCLQRAGIVPDGTTSGERMHKARHTAGQRLLDATGNLKAVQKLLGHESIQTTGDIYTDWDVEQLAESLLEAVQDDENGIVPQGASGNPHG